MSLRIPVSSLERKSKSSYSFAQEGTLKKALEVRFLKVNLVRPLADSNANFIAFVVRFRGFKELYDLAPQPLYILFVKIHRRQGVSDFQGTSIVQTALY